MKGLNQPIPLSFGESSKKSTEEINSGSKSSQNRSPEHPVRETRRSRRAKLTAEYKILGRKGVKTDGKTGRWSTQEHIRFLQGLKRHGKDWKLVQNHVNDVLDNPEDENPLSLRSGPQIRSHAQKFFKRILPNCIPGETPIQCLYRTNFDIEVIIAGTEESEDKISLVQKLKDNLEDFPE